MILVRDALVLSASLFLLICSWAIPVHAQETEDAGGATGGGGARLQISPEVVRLKAQVYLAEKDYPAAGRLLGAYLRSNPSDQEAWILMGRVYEGLERWDLALKALGRAGEAQGVHLSKARVYFGMGKMAEAIAEAKTSVSNHPDFGDSHHFLGYLYLTQKDYGNAAASLRTAIEKKTTKLIPTYYFLGQALFNLKRYDEAEQYFKMVHQDGADTDYAKPTEDFLDLINLRKSQQNVIPMAETRPSGARKPWKAYVKLAVEYDSNVLLGPDGKQLVSGVLFDVEDGVRNVLASGIDMQIYKDRDFHLRGSADLTFAYDYLVDEAQLLTIQAGIYSPIPFRGAGDEMSVTPYILGRGVYFGKFGATELDGNLTNGNDAIGFSQNGTPYSVEIEPGARFSWKHDDRMVFSAAANYYLSKYTDQSPKSTPQFEGAATSLARKDGHNLRVLLMEDFTLDTRASKDLTLSPMLMGAYRVTPADRDFSYWALEGGLQAAWKFERDFKASLGVRYRYENYFDSPAIVSSFPKKRVDQTVTADIGGEYRFYNDTRNHLGWWLLGGVLLEKNFSSLHTSPTDLEYTKWVYSLGVRLDI